MIYRNKAWLKQRYILEIEMYNVGKSDRYPDGSKIMKQLTISLKTSHAVLNDFKNAYEKAKSHKLKEPHYEVSFDNKIDFDRFIKNIHILSDILVFKPKSIYELAKISGMDVSNLNKIILFFEEIDVIRIVKTVVSGRTIKTPIVDYDRIAFKLAA
ncbi:MAG: hypothetical protein ACKVQC_00870 [Elusimicrobiota bacterium]